MVEGREICKMGVCKVDFILKIGWGEQVGTGSNNVPIKVYTYLFNNWYGPPKGS